MDVPAEIEAKVIATFFTAIVPLVLGATVNASITLVAVIRHPGPLFPALLATELAFFLMRLMCLDVGRRKAARGTPGPTDWLIASSIAWAAIVGLDAAAFVLTRDPVLQALAPACVLGMLSGLVTRNYGAPRLAVLQVILCDLPFNLAIPFCGEPWLLLSCAQCPLFIIGMYSAVRRLNRTYLAALVAERNSAIRASRDGLTGLLNRSGLMTALDHIMTRQQRLPLSLLYLDLDGFKRVNDRHGHGPGDDLLRQVADRISATAPEAAVCARLGGDEFVVVLPDCCLPDASLIAGAMIATLSEPYELDEATVRVGASIGIAAAVQTTTPETLLADSDSALYLAKAGGKGRFVVADQASPTTETVTRAA